MSAIYDKLKAIVAINHVYYQIIKDERQNLKGVFRDENMIQDLLTKKIMEQNKYIDDEDELEKGLSQTPAFKKATYQ